MLRVLTTAFAKMLIAAFTLMPIREQSASKFCFSCESILTVIDTCAIVYHVLRCKYKQFISFCNHFDIKFNQKHENIGVFDYFISIAPHPSAFFTQPSAFFLLPSTFFLLPSSISPHPSAFFTQPSAFFYQNERNKKHQERQGVQLCTPFMYVSVYLCGNVASQYGTVAHTELDSGTKRVVGTDDHSILVYGVGRGHVL